MADITNWPSDYDAPNLRMNVVAVIADPAADHLGDMGDETHQEGAGDHTRHSTHEGKQGYPEQGELHAHDAGMTEARLALLERFSRLCWRQSLFVEETKYVNVLHRHWNLQTEANARAARAGTLKPRYSGDKHFHRSLENCGGELFWATFLAWERAGHPGTITVPSTSKGFLMALTDQQQSDLYADVQQLRRLLENPIGGATGPIPRQAWIEGWNAAKTAAGKPPPDIAALAKALAPAVAAEIAKTKPAA